MTEEEKKAIEIVKEIWQFTDYSTDKIALKVVLDLIKKLQKENKEKSGIYQQAKTEIENLREKTEKYYMLIYKIREKIEDYQNEIECEKSYLEQGIICEEEYKDRVKVYNSYIFILNKLLEEG